MLKCNVENVLEVEKKKERMLLLPAGFHISLQGQDWSFGASLWSVLDGRRWGVRNQGYLSLQLGIECAGQNRCCLNAKHKQMPSLEKEVGESNKTKDALPNITPVPFCQPAAAAGDIAAFPSPPGQVGGEANAIR